MSASVIFISGRSIDGTVYWSGDGWSSSYVGAKEIRTIVAAGHAIAFLQADASPCVGPDEVVGRLAIHCAKREVVEAAYNAAMMEEIDDEG